MLNAYYDNIVRDETYGRCKYLAESVEYGDIHISYLEYEMSPVVKKAGGRYCLQCEETGESKFYRTDYMAMHALNKFIKDQAAKYREMNKDV